MENNKIITAEMTNEFFENTWCNTFERNNLLERNKLIQREFFSKTNDEGYNLRLEFLFVSKKYQGYYDGAKKYN